jgi:hypothetical protein
VKGLLPKQRKGLKRLLQGQRGEKREKEMLKHELKLNVLP